MLEIKSNKKTFFSGFSTYFKTILTGKELRVARLTGSQLRECRELYKADTTVLVILYYLLHSILDKGPSFTIQRA